MKISHNECVSFISLTVPYIGDLVSCNYCGNGCLEIKCPFDSREKFVFEILDRDDSYLEGDFKNGIKLKTTKCFTIKYSVS